MELHALSVYFLSYIITKGQKNMKLAKEKVFLN